MWERRYILPSKALPWKYYRYIPCPPKNRHVSHAQYKLSAAVSHPNRISVVYTSRFRCKRFLNDIQGGVENCVSIIQRDLKSKTMDYLEKNYNPWSEQKPEDVVVEDIFENEDVFDFEIKTDEKTIMKKRFTGNVYPQRVRYSVDIRKLIPSLIKEIQETFSAENFCVIFKGMNSV